MLPIGDGRVACEDTCVEAVCAVRHATDIRCYRSVQPAGKFEVVTLRSSVFPAALALVGCLPTESELPPPVETVTYSTPEIGGDCALEHFVHHLAGQVVRQDSADKSAVAQGSLLVTVSESQSIVSCTEDLVTMSTPGAELATASFDLYRTSFALDVPTVVVAGQHPAIRVRALLDVNDNGLCDEGELVGDVTREDTALGDLTIVVSAERGCPAYE